MKARFLAAAAALLLAAAAAAQAPEAPSPALAKLGELVGGRWVGALPRPEGMLPVELVYERALGGKAVRYRGVVGMGTPAAFHTEAFYGWDPANKNVYYVDLHGHQDVFRGTARLNGEVLESEFERLVGAPAKWSSTHELKDRDTLVFTLYSAGEAQRQQLFTLTLRRQKEGDVPSRGAAAGDLDAALKLLGRMTGGRWQSSGRQPDGSPSVNLGYHWGPDGRTLRGGGTIFGTEIESRFGWDPGAKKVFYLDFHGASTVYFGHVSVEGESFTIDFKSVVGTPAAWRSRARLATDDTYEATIQRVKDGVPGESHDVRLTRVR